MLAAVLLHTLAVGGAAASTGVPLFHSPPVVSPFGLTNVFAYNAPAAADLDADGDLDFVVGDSQGNTTFFRNIGSATAPAFAAPVTTPSGSPTSARTPPRASATSMATASST